MDKKVDLHLGLRIIEEIPDGLQDRFTPLVFVPIGDGDVRVCVDMRCANQAIIRESHPIPVGEGTFTRFER